MRLINSVLVLFLCTASASILADKNELNVPVDVNVLSMPDVQGTVNVGNTLTVVNGDHPALTTFTTYDSKITSADNEYLEFNPDRDVCDPNQLVVLTHIDGTVEGEPSGAETLPPRVFLYWFGAYRHHLSQPYVTEGPADTETTVYAHDSQLVLPNERIYLQVKTNDKYIGQFSIWFTFNGYCFTP